jgi:hypothetical protein
MINPVWVVTAEHPTVPGIAIKICATEDLGHRAARALALSILNDLGSPLEWAVRSDQITWEQAMELAEDDEVYSDYDFSVEMTEREVIQ